MVSNKCFYSTCELYAYTDIQHRDLYIQSLQEMYDADSSDPLSQFQIAGKYINNALFLCRTKRKTIQALIHLFQVFTEDPLLNGTTLDAQQPTAGEATALTEYVPHNSCYNLV